MSVQTETDFNNNLQSENSWKQGRLVEIEITDLTDSGDGVGRYEGRVVFVPDTVVGDRILARLLRVKPQYANGKLQELLEASPHRIRPSCIVADKCGGCQWQHIDYAYQLEAKRNLVVQALERIGGMSNPPVDEVLAMSSPLGYRNKAAYPVGLSSSYQVQAGYYQKGSHKLVNLNQCPVQDERLNPLLAEIKADISEMGWRVYNEQHHRGQIRHIAVRIGKHTGEILLTLVATDDKLPRLTMKATEWMKRYSGLVGVCLNINPDRTNVIFGSETRCILGKAQLEEEFAGLELQLGGETFFQVNTEVAEKLLAVLQEALNLQGTELLVDAYCGVGTFTLPLAKGVREAIGIEVQPEAIAQANFNAQRNQIENVEFQVGTVEGILPQLTMKPDIVLVDPPRQGCDRTVLDALMSLQPQRIVYISCKPSTLARDLKILCEEGGYRLTRVQPADFFPQTSHVECAAFLER